MKTLRVVLVKPGKYGVDGYLERFKVGFMPNATLHHIAALTPRVLSGCRIEIELVDEYVQTDLDYLRLLQPAEGAQTLLALVGVQSNQFHRALDLAALARANGIAHCVIGGPHPMTCDTSMLQGRGVSFALAEGEAVWRTLLEDALGGGLAPVYGSDQRWASALIDVVVEPPPARDLARYWAPMLGLYPVRGCPYTCSYCSVIRIAGRQVRSTAIESTIESMRRARAAGIDTIMFTSDNFNKYPQAPTLLQAMIDEQLGLRFFCQCDTQVGSQEALVELMGRAGCFEIFVGVESFDRAQLKSVNKYHNHPERYRALLELCRSAGIRAHFSNIIGFPDQDEAGVLRHLDVVEALAPDIASFYILTPIPGTEQYEDFFRQGLLTEPNLDRYDAAFPTWCHPNIAPTRMLDLLFHCYEDFYRRALAGRAMRRDDRRLAYFNRHAAGERQHPMSGGIGRVRLDRAEDYRALRRGTYGVDLAPLPRGLRLSPQDEARNRSAALRNGDSIPA